MWPGYEATPVEPVVLTYQDAVAILQRIRFPVQNVYAVLDLYGTAHCVKIVSDSSTPVEQSSEKPGGMEVRLTNLSCVLIIWSDNAMSPPQTEDTGSLASEE